MRIPEDAFWDMTPAQFRRRLDAWQMEMDDRIEIERFRQDQANHRNALIRSTIMNFSGRGQWSLPKGKKMTADELLGTRSKKRIEDMDAARKRVNRRFNLKRRYGFEL